MHTYLQILNQIKEIIRSIVPGATVILFGSRARGDYEKDSDYDLLVVTKEKYFGKARIYKMTEISKAIIQSLHLSCDILLHDEESVNEKKELPGHIIKTALHEGMLL